MIAPRPPRSRMMLSWAVCLLPAIVVLVLLILGVLG